MMLLAAMLPAGAASPAVSAPLSVADLVAHHAALEGRTVAIVGTLERCQPLSCGLYGDADGAGVVARVSFAAAPAFDRAIAALAGRRVVVEGIVTDRCWATPSASGDISVCTDRADQFKPLRVARVLDPARQE